MAASTPLYMTIARDVCVPGMSDVLAKYYEHHAPDDPKTAIRADTAGGAAPIVTQLKADIRTAGWMGVDITWIKPDKLRKYLPLSCEMAPIEEFAAKHFSSSGFSELRIHGAPATTHYNRCGVTAATVTDFDRRGGGGGAPAAIGDDPSTDAAEDLPGAVLPVAPSAVADQTQLYSAPVGSVMALSGQQLSKAAEEMLPAGYTDTYMRDLIGICDRLIRTQDTKPNSSDLEPTKQAMRSRVVDSTLRLILSAVLGQTWKDLRSGYSPAEQQVQLRKTLGFVKDMIALPVFYGVHPEMSVSVHNAACNVAFANMKKKLNEMDTSLTQKPMASLRTTYASIQRQFNDLHANLERVAFTLAFVPKSLPIDWRNRVNLACKQPANEAGLGALIDQHRTYSDLLECLFPSKGYEDGANCSTLSVAESLSTWVEFRKTFASGQFLKECAWYALVKFQLHFGARGFTLSTEDEVKFRRIGRMLNNIKNLNPLDISLEETTLNSSHPSGGGGATERVIKTGYKGDEDPEVTRAEFVGLIKKLIVLDRSLRVILLGSQYRDRDILDAVGNIGQALAVGQLTRIKIEVIKHRLEKVLETINAIEEQATQIAELNVGGASDTSLSGKIKAGFASVVAKLPFDDIRTALTQLNDLLDVVYKNTTPEQAKARMDEAQQKVNLGHFLINTQVPNPTDRAISLFPAALMAQMGSLVRDQAGAQEVASRPIPTTFLADASRMTAILDDEAALAAGGLKVSEESLDQLKYLLSSLLQMIGIGARSAAAQSTKTIGEVRKHLDNIRAETVPGRDETTLVFEEITAHVEGVLDDREAAHEAGARVSGDSRSSGGTLPSGEHAGLEAAILAARAGSVAAPPPPPAATPFASAGGGGGMHPEISPDDEFRFLVNTGGGVQEMRATYNQLMTGTHPALGGQPYKPSRWPPPSPADNNPIDLIQITLDAAAPYYS